MAPRIRKIVCVVTFLLTGCSASYSFDGRQFDRPNDALDYFQNILNEVTAEIAPVEAPLADHVVIVLPSREQYERFIRAEHPGINTEQFNFGLRLAEMQTLWTPELIERRGVFKEMRVVRAEEPTGAAAPSDAFLIWNQRLTGTKDNVRFYLMAPGETQKTELAQLDSGQKAGATSAMQQSRLIAKQFLDEVMKFVATHSPAS